MTCPLGGHLPTGAALAGRWHPGADAGQASRHCRRTGHDSLAVRSHGWLSDILFDHQPWSVNICSPGSSRDARPVGLPQRGQCSGIPRCMTCRSHASHSPWRSCNGGLPWTSYRLPSMMLRTRPSNGWIAGVPHPTQGFAMALSFMVVPHVRNVLIRRILFIK